MRVYVCVRVHVCECFNQPTLPHPEQSFLSPRVLGCALGPSKVHCHGTGAGNLSGVPPPRGRTGTWALRLHPTQACSCWWVGFVSLLK